MADDWTPEDWQRVARRITGRMTVLGYDNARVKREGGPSNEMLSGYKRGRPISKRTTRTNLCTALQWTPDSIDLILQGGDPVELHWGTPRSIGTTVAGTASADAAPDNVDLIEQRLHELVKALADQARSGTLGRGKR